MTFNFDILQGLSDFYFFINIFIFLVCFFFPSLEHINCVLQSSDSPEDDDDDGPD